VQRLDTSPIVAVVSSADDLEAVSELLSALPAECSATFIVVQHLNSGRERLLAEALARRTLLPVMYARDAVVAEQDHSPRSRKSVALAQSAWSSH
jgi:chemotaxis response regulator CheB